MCWKRFLHKFSQFSAEVNSFISILEFHCKWGIQWNKFPGNKYKISRRISNKRKIRKCLEFTYDNEIKPKIFLIVTTNVMMIKIIGFWIHFDCYHDSFWLVFFSSVILWLGILNRWDIYLLIYSLYGTIQNVEWEIQKCRSHRNLKLIVYAIVIFMLLLKICKWATMMSICIDFIWCVNVVVVVVIHRRRCRFIEIFNWKFFGVT